MEKKRGAGFCCAEGEGSSGILINLYCHMWEASFTRGLQGGNVTAGFLSNGLTLLGCWAFVK